MSRVRNADDFRDLLKRIFADAEQVRATANKSSKTVVAADDSSEADEVEDSREELLECHAREFFIDRLLGALNWQKAPLLNVTEYVQNNMTIEQHADFGIGDMPREDDEKRKRMDYFGFERETDRPLLVVEAKRPTLKLPRGTTAAINGAFRTYLLNSRTGDYKPRQAGLTGAWGECLDQVREYAQSVFAASSKDKRWPRKVVICNGSWLVVFAEPHLAFSKNSTNVGEIVLFESKDAIFQRAGEVWGHLEYGTLAGDHPPCLPADIPFLVDESQIQMCMFALKILCARRPSHYRRSEPCIMIMPTLVLRATGGAFLTVGFEGPDDDEAPEFELPKGIASVDAHLGEVKQEAEKLKRRVEEVIHRVDRPLPLVSVRDHMQDAEAFKVLATVRALRSVKLRDGDEGAFVVTGTQTHFLLPSATHRDCIHHRHSESERTHTSHLTHAITKPSMRDRSHFSDGSPFHCTHREVFAPKSQSVTRANRERCGPRSCQDSGAFCELWSLEHMLCCRTCVFQAVCVDSKAFSLPCQPPSAGVQLTVNKVPVPAIEANPAAH